MGNTLEKNFPYGWGRWGLNRGTTVPLKKTSCFAFFFILRNTVSLRDRFPGDLLFIPHTAAF